MNEFTLVEIGNVLSHPKKELRKTLSVITATVINHRYKEMPVDKVQSMRLTISNKDIENLAYRIKKNEMFRIKEVPDDTVSSNGSTES